MGMTTARGIWLLACVLWIAAEIALARSKSRQAQPVIASEQHSQWLLWSGLLLTICLALWLKTQAWTPIPIAYWPRQAVALVLFGLGLALRYAAIRQLGQYFTTHVTIQTQHQLIANGPYRWLRHPAYSGLLLAFSAAGLAMGDGLALLVIICACGGVLAYRIGVEERLLHDCFGPAFNDYCQTRKRLIPGIW
jgi:protein-S-isoprenylcysteine O-methyltransferase